MKLLLGIVICGLVCCQEISQLTFEKDIKLIEQIPEDIQIAIPGQETQAKPFVPDLDGSQRPKHQHKDKKCRHDRPLGAPEFAGCRQQDRDIKGEDKNNMHQWKRHSRRSCWGFLLMALLFTVLGVLLAKCCKRLKRKRRENQKRRRIATRSLRDVELEIKEHEASIQNLKEQYERKRVSQQAAYLNMRPQHLNMNMNMMPQQMNMNVRPQQMNMRPQQFNGYAGFYQPMPQANYRNNQECQIPIGRPINESRNSSFAQEYPQL